MNLFRSISLCLKIYFLLYNSFFRAPGELSREEDVLEWLIANKSTGDEEDVIEDVTAKTLNTLIGNIDNLVVLFCKYFCCCFPIYCFSFIYYQ